VIKIKSPICKGLSSKKRGRLQCFVATRFNGKGSEKYPISVGLILKNMHMQGISRPFLRRVNGKKIQTQEREKNTPLS